MEQIKSFIKRKYKIALACVLCCVLLVCSCLSTFAREEKVTAKLQYAQIVANATGDSTGALWGYYDSYNVRWSVVSPANSNYRTGFYCYPEFTTLSSSVVLNEIVFYGYFTVYDDYVYDYTQTNAFFKSFGYAVCVINGISYDVVLGSYNIDYIDDLHYRVNFKASVNFATPLMLGANTTTQVHFGLHSADLYYVPQNDTIISISAFDEESTGDPYYTPETQIHADFRYDVNQRYGVSLSPEEEGSINNAYSSGAGWDDMGNAIKDQVGGLDDSMPESFDAFANAPDHLVYAQGSPLFVTLFANFHNSEVIGPFITSA